MTDPKIFKAYDIRGIYPDQIDADTAYRIGQGYADFVKPTKPVAVGRDVRLHSEELQQAAIKGLTDAGVDVIDIGLVSTEMLYFAVGNFGYGGGISATASHNPPEWQGFKFVREEVIPLSGESGIREIKEFIENARSITVEKKGTVTKKDILDDFCKYLLDKWVDMATLMKLKLVYNANFGFEGKVLQRLVEMGNLPVELIPLNAEPDGTFPKGRPDPFVPENRAELVAMVKESKADLGVAWDADADRVFLCTDEGVFVEAYYTNAILIKALLKKFPGEKILYDPRYAWALVDTTNESGGTPLLDRVGYVYIKARMRKDNIIFSGESSGHTFFRDYWYSDTGMIPLLLVWELLSKENKKYSELIGPLMNKYFISGEINSEIEDKDGTMKRLEKHYPDAKIDHVDGVTIEYPGWRTNVRPSNTEPLLRMNLEAKSMELMQQKRDEVLKIMRENV